MSKVAELVQRARALVFDFDGTLVDSNPIKWRAFERCFEDFPERRDEILAYCWNYNHTPRGEKFRYVYEDILGLQYTSEVEAALHRRFDEETTRQIIEAPALPGAEEFLRGAQHTHVTALLSSTPNQILDRIITERRWRQYFKMVRGAPVNKAAWLGRCRKKKRWSREEVIFFGDTPEDRQAAETAGCVFIAVGNGLLGAEGASSYIRDFAILLMQ